jgi:hypothetical protein
MSPTCVKPITCDSSSSMSTSYVIMCTFAISALLYLWGSNLSAVQRYI